MRRAHICVCVLRLRLRLRVAGVCVCVCVLAFCLFVCLFVCLLVFLFCAGSFGRAFAPQPAYRRACTRVSHMAANRELNFAKLNSRFQPFHQPGPACFPAGAVPLPLPRTQFGTQVTLLHAGFLMGSGVERLLEPLQIALQAEVNRLAQLPTNCKLPQLAKNSGRFCELHAWSNYSAQEAILAIIA